jgi:hypothetical protein
MAEDRAAPEKKAGYEKRDLSLKLILTFFGVLLAVAIVNHVVLAVWLRDLISDRRLEDRPSSAHESKGFQFSTPHLMTHEGEGLPELRAWEDVNLSTYGWVDRGRGIARIPVDRAMDILLEKKAFPARGGTAAGLPEGQP